MKKITSVKLWSFVHEVGDEHEDTPTPYEHTHVFIWSNKPIETYNARFFDIADIHPNIQTQRSLQWAKTTCMKYHLGHKTKDNGKKYYLAPVFLHQDGIAAWKMEEETMAIAVAAPSLPDACIELGVTCKSVGDVYLIRKESGKRKATLLSDRCDPAKFRKVDWDKSCALILRGPPETGKTSWAIHQFKCPMKIEDLDELKSIPQDCDGLVFDEMLFDKCCKKTMVSLLDMEYERTIRTWNTNSMIPRGIARMFTCNEHEHPFW